MQRNKSPLYRPWYQFKASCERSDYNNSQYYNHRGCRFYPPWSEYKWGFDRFEHWVLSQLGPKPQGDSILCRFDAFGDVAPGNLQWSTRFENANVRQGCRMITIAGLTQSLSDWCRTTGVNFHTAHSRIVDYGWTPEKAIEYDR